MYGLEVGLPTLRWQRFQTRSLAARRPRVIAATMPTARSFFWKWSQSVAAGEGGGTRSAKKRNRSREQPVEHAHRVPVVVKSGIEAIHLSDSLGIGRRQR